MKKKTNKISEFSKEKVISLLNYALFSPLRPTDAYGISLEARIKEVISDIERM